jgi:hypothetical protein
MIWLTWRQHRKQAMFTLIGLAVLAALMVPSGIAMHNTFDRLKLGDCLARLGAGSFVPASPAADQCGEVAHQFTEQYNVIGSLGVLLIFIPLLVGLFWGAPLIAREVEHGTHRLVWTQGVSRRHWAMVKIGMVGGAVAVLAAVYGLGMSWWFGPMSRAGQTRFGIPFFDVQGVAPIGYTLFAVALGIFAGTVWHRVLPAMGVTLAGFLGLRILLTGLARSHYLAPKTLTFPLASALQPNEMNGDWVLNQGIRNAAGELIAPNAVMQCHPAAPGPGAACGGDLGIGAGAYNWELYQPAARFWLFQGIETGVFVVLAAVLIAFAIRRIRRIA